MLVTVIAKMFKKNFFIILLGALSLTGVCLLLLSTSRWGVILEMDSVYYLLLAQFFGNYTVHKDIAAQILCNLQPLFSMVLSWGHFIRVDPLEGARWFNSILFGFNIILIGVITKKYTKSVWMGSCAALLFLSAPDILEIHLTAMNEPLFIFFMLMWLLLFLDYLKDPKLSVLILSSMIVALASMTKFSGIPIITTGLFAILFLNREGNLINKFIHAVIFVSIPCLSLFLWSKYSYIKDSPLQRHFALHPVNLSFFRDMASVFCSWFLSPNVNASANEKMFLFTMGMAFCFIGLFLWHRTNKIPGSDPQQIIFTKFSILGIAFICLYVACLIFSTSFYDADMYHSLNRYFIPIHVTGLIIFCGFMTSFFQEHPSSFKKDMGRIIVVYFFLFYIAGSVQCLMHQYYLGDKYADNPFRFSYIIRKIKTMPVGAPIYTNDFQSVYVWGGKFPFPIPTTENLFSLGKNDKYLSQLSQMMTDLRKNKGILVYFNNNIQKYTEPIKTLQKRIPLHLIARDKYASIFDVQ